MTIEFSPRSRRDVADIVDYWLDAREEPQAAIVYLERIEEAIGRVAGNPASGRLRKEFGPGLRSVPAVPYVIYYRIREDIREDRFVEIVRVLHGARDAAAEFADAP